MAPAPVADMPTSSAAARKVRMDDPSNQGMNRMPRGRLHRPRHFPNRYFTAAFFWLP
jgi:hypothetical protein